MPALGDKYGRLTVFLATMVMMIPVYLCCIWAKNLVLVNLAMFYAGLISIGRFMNGYLLLTELIPERNIAVVGPAVLSLDVAVVLYLSLYFRWVSKDFMPTYYIGITVNILTMVLLYLKVPESVRWLLSVHHYDRAKKVMKQIADTNGVRDFAVTSFKSEIDFLTGATQTVSEEMRGTDVSVNPDDETTTAREAEDGLKFGTGTPKSK